MSRERFEQLAEDAVTQRTDPTPTAATVERAFYAVRLEQDGLVDGRAELDIQVPDKNSSPLPLVPAGFRSANHFGWGRTGAARVGWVSPGQIAVFAARSATLSFSWSLQGNREAMDGVSFSLVLPRSIATRLVFDIPARYRLISSHGIMQRLLPTNSNNRRSTAAAEAGVTPTAKRGRRDARSSWADCPSSMAPLAA